MPLATVPFSKLTAPESINARPATKDGLDELAASIIAKGLIQPLAVRPADGESGRYEVIDGRRRYFALQKLVRDKQITKGFEVEVIVRNEDDAEALETSLIANTVRLPMHPVDQHAVFARLAAQGVKEAEIASRFGLPERQVKQRLALGGLAPSILKAWRDGKIDEKCAQAFTLDPRQDVQEAAWARIKKRTGHISEYDVRHELTGDRPAANDIPADLLDAYLAAGGTVTTSLFEDERYVDDPAIMRQVEADYLEKVRQRLLADGWAWAALSSDVDRDWRWDWDNVLGEAQHDDPPYTEAELARIHEIDAQLDELNHTGAEADALDRERERIDDAAEQRRYSREQRARSGCVIEFKRYNSGINIAYGLLRPAEDGQTDLEDSIEAADDADEDESMSDVGQPATDDDEHDGPSISGALLETLTTAQTKAAADALPYTPRLALKAALAALTCGSPWDSPVKLRIDVQGLSHTRRPGGYAKAFADLDGVSDPELLVRFANVICDALDLVARHAGAEREHATAIVAALDSERYLEAMRRRFLAEDYFKRVPKAMAIAALDEMAEAGVVPRAQVALLEDAKKQDIVDFATNLAQQCGWLPRELRCPAYALASTGNTEAAA